MEATILFSFRRPFLFDLCITVLEGMSVCILSNSDEKNTERERDIMMCANLYI